LIEARISYLENKINKSEVIQIDTSEKISKIKFGATVTLQDEENLDKIKRYQLVGSDEASIEQNLLSITSPLGKELLGKEADTSVEVTTPGGSVYYIIKKIELI